MRSSPALLVGISIASRGDEANDASSSKHAVEISLGDIHSSTHDRAASSLPSPPLLKALLLRLAPIRPPTLRSLLHARAQIDVDSGRNREAERLRDLLQVQLVDIEHASKTVRRICLQV